MHRASVSGSCTGPGPVYIQHCDCRLKTPEEIRNVFVSAGVNLEEALVSSCGTGVTATVLALALEQLSPKPKVQYCAMLHTGRCSGQRHNWQQNSAKKCCIALSSVVYHYMSSCSCCSSCATVSALALGHNRLCRTCCVSSL